MTDVERDEPGGAEPELRGARPALDRLRMESVRARAEQALFGSAAPATWGRYVLLGERADGGMGVVYAAYDPDLDRKVALKVVHPRHRDRDTARDRLVLEARALAKLDHPNVVKVHDVISRDAQVVIVMEWVEGTTLAEPPPGTSWRDVVTVYVQAGRGLAAAHGVGVVHRDFKPANAILGTDGRVRVLDFGLARLTTSPEAVAAAAPVAMEPAELDLTRTGDVVGTLGYSAPEQLAGAEVTAASDQFSVAVALHRALEGRPPFDGADPQALLASIRAGHPAVSDRRLPGWLRAALRRALAADPTARFRSLDAFLTELTRPRGLRRWRLPLVALACALVPTIALLARRAPDPLAACDGGFGDIDPVWNAGQRARLAAAIDAVGTPYARSTRDRILSGLDAYRDRWTSLHRDACVAHRRGAQSEALLDRRMACLQHRLGDLRASVAVLAQLDAASAPNAVDVVLGTRDPTECADLDRLQVDIAPPTTERTAVEAARQQLSRAVALDHAGRSREALDAATEVVRAAERTAYAPLIAEASLARGRVLISRNELEAATASLARARTAALEVGLLPLAVEAGARQLFTEGLATGDHIAIEREVAVWLPLSKGLAGDHFARPLLLNNLGTVYMAAGDRAQASRYFQDARSALAGVPEPALELTCIDKNLAMLTPDDRAREALARGVWARRRAALGDDHLSTLEALDSYARYTADPARALELLTRACTAYATSHPDLIERRVYCASYQAFLAGYLGDRTTELRLYDEVAALASRDPALASRAALARGHAALLRSEPRTALESFRTVIAAERSRTEWWQRLVLADAERGLAAAHRALGYGDQTRDAIEIAEAIYATAMQLSEEVEFRLRRERLPSERTVNHGNATPR